MWRHYRKLYKNEFIVVGVDTAAGGIDYCAAQFISNTQLDVPLVYHAKELATDMTPKLHNMLEGIYDITQVQPVVAYERNNGGVFEIERLARLNKSGKYRIYQTKTNIGTIKGAQKSPQLGWSTNTATRPTMLADLKDAVDNRLLMIYDRPTLAELFSFIVVQSTSSWKAQAEQGKHDDLVMSLAIAWQLYQSEKPINQLQRSGTVQARRPEERTITLAKDGTGAIAESVDLEQIVKTYQTKQEEKDWRYV